jgi:hypothetical protein
LNIDRTGYRQRFQLRTPELVNGKIVVATTTITRPKLVSLMFYWVARYSPRWSWHLKRVTAFDRSAACLVCLPVTRLRHITKLARFSCLRISAITCGSRKPNCLSIASNGVRSSHAICTTRSISIPDNGADRMDVTTGYDKVAFRFARHASEQYNTFAQFFAQDFRHVMVRPQTAQGFSGR